MFASFALVFAVACGGKTAPSATPDPGAGAGNQDTMARAIGAACVSADQCISGMCEGQGCGDDAPGVCVDPARMCTMDIRPYCGCDGVTFESSGSCPGKRFSEREACAAE